MVEVHDIEHGFPVSDTKNVLRACRLVDYTGFSVTAGFINDTWVLHVWGNTVFPAMKVGLHPLIYTHQPDYWKIQVIGCLTGAFPSGSSTFFESLPLDGVLGTRGIRLIGSTLDEKMDVPPGGTWGDLDFKVAGGGNSFSVG